MYYSLLRRFYNLVVEEEALQDEVILRRYYSFLLFPSSSFPSSPSSFSPSSPSSSLPPKGSLPLYHPFQGLERKQSIMYAYRLCMNALSFIHPMFFVVSYFMYRPHNYPFASQENSPPFIRAMAPSPKWPRNKRPLNQHKSKNKGSSSEVY